MNNKKKTNLRLFLCFCIIPSLVLYSLFILYPTIKVFSMSLYSWTGLGSAPKFIGLNNFKDLISDKVFLISLKNTIFLIAVVPICTILLSLLFAFILTQGEIREKNFYRTIFFFPSVLSFVVIAILWSFIYHPTMGVLNSMIKVLGMDNLSLVWLGNKKTVMWAIAVVLIWQAVGYYMVMYMAGIDNISKEIFEAADIDGASSLVKFCKITLPLLWEIIRVTIIFSINGVITISFTVVTVMTGGGPDVYSEVVLTQMYKQGFVNSNFGYAMAIGVVVFVLSIVLSVISNKLTEKNTI